MKLHFKFILLLLLCVYVYTEFTRDPITTEAQTLVKRFHESKLLSYKHHFKQSDINITIVSFTPVFQYSDIEYNKSLTNPIITFKDVSVSLYYNVTFYQYSESGERYVEMTKQNCVSNLQYDVLTFMGSVDGSYDPPSLSNVKDIQIDFGELEDYALFEEVFRNDKKVLKDLSETVWDNMMRNVLKEYPKCFAIQNFDMLVSYIKGCGRLFVKSGEKEGIKTAELKTIGYEDMKKFGMYGSFLNVNVDVKVVTDKYDSSTRRVTFETITITEKSIQLDRCDGTIVSCAIAAEIFEEIYYNHSWKID